MNQCRMRAITLVRPFASPWMDSDDDRVVAIARMLTDDGDIDNNADAQQAAARILQIVQTHLPSEALAAAQIATRGAATRD